MAAEILGALVVEPLLGSALSKVISIVDRLIGLKQNPRKQLRKLGRLLRMIRPVLERAESRQESDLATIEWVNMVKRVVYQLLNVLDEYERCLIQRKVQARSLLRKGVSCLLNTFCFPRRFSNRIKEINKSFNELREHAVFANFDSFRPSASARPTQCPTTDSLLDPKIDFVGREVDVSRIDTWLGKIKTCQEPLSVVSIEGLPGVGKTELARSVYNKAKHNYDLKAWVCISKKFDDERVLAEILEGFNAAGNHPTVSPPQNIDALLQQLEKEIVGKTFLICLDHMWNEDVEGWERFIDRFSKIVKTTGNSILVTTHSGKLASFIDETSPSSKRHFVEGLSDDQCWSIMKKKILKPAEELDQDLEGIGPEIAAQCRGMPLIAVVLARRMLCEKERERWLSMRNRQNWNSEDNRRILSALRIIFDDLPSALKQCFSYCAIFEKGSIIRKEEVVKLWMAHGFLTSTECLSRNDECMLEERLDDLLSNFWFQVVETDQYGNIQSFTMHPEVHNLAVFVSKGETSILEAGSTDETNESYDLRDVRVKGTWIPDILEDVAPNLRSWSSEVDAFSRLSTIPKNLRSLNLSGGDTDYLPAKCLDQKHLRYLRISNTKIRALSKNVSRLYLLQTFEIVNSDLKRLPDIRNLVNLRHVCFDDEALVLKHVGCLTSLQTLPLFVVGKKKGCHIEELGSLNQLGGELKICKLEHVKSREEAAKANLEEKKRLSKLHFKWSENATGISNVTDVLEGLQPPPKVKGLIFENYTGEKFPAWMEFLSDVTELELINCPELKGICTNRVGPEWSKISKIPNIKIDSEVVQPQV